MTPTEQDKMSEEELTKAIYEAMQVPYLSERHDAIKQLITADRKRVALEARIDPFDFVESCEPDCNDVRHAYHKGQWDMATRIEAKQEEL